MSTEIRSNTTPLRQARQDDLHAISELLRASGLPADDLVAAHLATFYVATVDDAVVGVAGIEAAAGAGLLRSLAVSPAQRGSGLARRLVDACEALARDKGLPALYLLTTTAADYFLRRGYDEVTRASVPAAIAAHPQFRGLCPASARCLCRRLAQSAGDRREPVFC